MSLKSLLDRFRLSVSLAAAALLFSATAPAQHYTQTNLISNTGVPGTKTDANLVNGWGLSRSSTSPWWVSDNGTGMASIYQGDGTIASLVVTVPGAPTGTVFNGTQDFKVNGAPAVFLFSSEDGTISAWNGSLGTQAMVVATTAGAIYKGLAIASFDGANYLYATDFHNGRIDVFDASFQPVRFGPRVSGGGDFGFLSGFRGFAAFNIQNIGGTLFVTVAKQDDARKDDVHGPGNGLVVALTPKGKLLRIFEHGPWLNSPWGLALAPGDFGIFSHDLLVGQFGSGQIAAYNIESGKFDGLLLDGAGSPIVIDGIWGIGFGNGQRAGPFNTLFFAAGPNDESNGLFGTLTLAAGEPTQGNSN